MNEFACGHGLKYSTDHGDQHRHMDGLKADSPDLEYGDDTYTEQCTSLDDQRMMPCVCRGSRPHFLAAARGFLFRLWRLRVNRSTIAARPGKYALNA